MEATMHGAMEMAKSKAHRTPSGQLSRAGKRQRGGENVKWHRIKWMIDNATEQAAVNPEMGSVISRYVMFGHLTQPEGIAARMYAEISGRHARYFTESAVSVPSPSFQRGFGADDELERISLAGDLDDYEKKARSARRQYNRLMTLVTRFPGAKEVLDRLCCMNEELSPGQRDDLKRILRHIMEEYRILSRFAAERGLGKVKGKPPKLADTKLMADAAVETLRNQFSKPHRNFVCAYKLELDPDGTARITARAYYDYQVVEEHTIEVKLNQAKINGRLAQPNAFAAALIRRAEVRGWKEIEQ